MIDDAKQCLTMMVEPPTATKDANEADGSRPCGVSRSSSARDQAAANCPKNAHVPHILVVDDEPIICALLRRGLEVEGFVVSEATSRSSLFRCLEREPIDLITLDLNLAGEDGLAIAQSVRASHNIPIVMITGRVTPEDRTEGLEKGADDYITKPFTMREVVLRIGKILGRYRKQAEDGTGPPTSPATERYKLDFGMLDIPRRELRSFDGERILLTDAELELLTIFARSPSRILSRNELMLLLRGREWSPLERTLDKLVHQLRRKIEPPGCAPHFIKTVRSIGYVYTGRAERV